MFHKLFTKDDFRMFLSHIPNLSYDLNFVKVLWDFFGNHSCNNFGNRNW